MFYVYKIQSTIIKACFYLSCFCVLYLMLFISFDVVLRYFGVSFFSGVVELSEYSLLAIAMLCAPWVYKKDFNLKVDILLMNRSVRFKEIHSYIVNFIILVSSLIVFYYGSLSLMDSIERDRYIFKMLVFPEWYINWIIPFSMFMVSSEAIFKLFSYNKNREA